MGATPLIIVAAHFHGCRAESQFLIIGHAEVVFRTSDTSDSKSSVEGVSSVETHRRASPRWSPAMAGRRTYSQVALGSSASPPKRESADAGNSHLGNGMVRAQTRSQSHESCRKVCARE